VLLKRLRISRLDNSHAAEMRKLIRVDLLLLDDFTLQPLDSTHTADIDELTVERHRAAAVVNSTREPIKAPRRRRSRRRSPQQDDRANLHH
jgi:DNA replication protein DnaC